MQIRSFFIYKIAAILAHDVECIYLFKLILSFSVTCLTPFLGSIAPLLCCSGHTTSQNQAKGERCKKLFKMAWYVKNVERSQKWGSVGNLWNAKSCFANARVKREFIKKKYKQ